MWISKREYNLLERELAFYRQALADERARADRLTDSLLQNNGQLPVSVGSLERREKSRQQMENIQAQMDEMFMDETDTPEAPPDNAEETTAVATAAAATD